MEASYKNSQITFYTIFRVQDDSGCRTTVTQCGQTDRPWIILYVSIAVACCTRYTPFDDDRAVCRRRQLKRTNINKKPAGAWQRSAYSTLCTHRHTCSTGPVVARMPYNRPIPFGGRDGGGGGGGAVGLPGAARAGGGGGRWTDLPAVVHPLPAAANAPHRASAASGPSPCDCCCCCWTWKEGGRPPFCDDDDQLTAWPSHIANITDNYCFLLKLPVFISVPTTTLQESPSLFRHRMYFLTPTKASQYWRSAHIHTHCCNSATTNWFTCISQ